jgi:hypothetical protein
MSANKFISFKDNTSTVSSSTFIINAEAKTRILSVETGDVSIIDLPSPDDYDLLHYRKTAITQQDISFRYKGVELIKAYKQHRQNLQFYHVNGTWIL